MSGLTLACVALAGGLGAATRFAVDAEVTRRLDVDGRARALPVGTLVVNLTGSLLLGLIVGLVARHPGLLPPALAAALGTGFCGGYTTFSTASLECLRLWIAGHRSPAAGYALLSLLGSVLAAVTGMALASL